VNGVNENAKTVEITCAVTGAAAEISLNQDGTPKDENHVKRNLQTDQTMQTC
jgi:hypothetical protein